MVVDVESDVVWVDLGYYADEVWLEAAHLVEVSVFDGGDFVTDFEGL